MELSRWRKLTLKWYNTFVEGKKKENLTAYQQGMLDKIESVLDDINEDVKTE